MSRIYLIGYMGSGKTTIAKLLAKELACPFVDLDEAIEHKYQLSVKQIFDKYGEARFREIESECLKDLGNLEDCIVATGGGTPCFNDNMDYMKKTGQCFYIKLSIDEIIERLKLIGVSKRPLLIGKSDQELKEFVSQAMSIREKYYLQADAYFTGTIPETLSSMLNYIENNKLINHP